MAIRQQDLAFTAERLVVEVCHCLRCGGTLTPLRRATAQVQVRCQRCYNPVSVEAGVRLSDEEQTGPSPIARSTAGEGMAVDRFVVLVDGLKDGHRAIYAVPAADPVRRQVFAGEARLPGRRPAPRLHLVS